MNPKFLVEPVAPMQLLPRLAHIEHISSLEIKTALDGLCALYFPHTLSASNIITDSLPIKVFTVLNSTPTQSPASDQYGIGIVTAAPVPDSGYASAEEDDDDPDTHECQAEDVSSFLRSDPFERAYAIKWLTGFVGRSDVWLSHLLPDDEEEDEALREELVEEAARLINAFSGNAAFSTDDEARDGGSISRSFSFSTPYTSFGRDCVRSTVEISIQLNDAPLSSSDHTSVGLQSWGSSIILTERICADPFAFNILARPDEPPTVLRRRSDIPSRPLRVLELGAGTGVLSIATFQLLHLHSRSAEIVATDYHPDVLTNLLSNVHTNLLHSGEAEANSSSITIHAFDWEHPDYSHPPFEEPFDIILAADVVYHPSHAAWIKNCVERLLLKPSGLNGVGGLLWLIIPIRMTGRHEWMHRTVEDVFPAAGLDAGGATRGCELHTLELSEVPRREGVGRADESAYRMHKIGWVSW